MDTLKSPGFGADMAHGGATLLGVLDAVQSGVSNKRYYSMAGSQAKKAAEFENTQYAAKGKEAVAVAQRDALSEEKRTQLSLSKAQAVAAASGGGAGDPGVLDIMGQLASEGNTNALSALYTGQATQVDYTNKAAANSYEAAAQAGAYGMRGQSSSNNMWNNIIGTVLQGSTSFLEKYG